MVTIFYLTWLKKCLCDHLTCKSS